MIFNSLSPTETRLANYHGVVHSGIALFCLNLDDVKRGQDVQIRASVDYSKP